VAKKRDLEIEISPNGEISVTISGFAGKQCMKIRDILEENVGTLKSQRFTSEYYEPDEKVDLRIRNRS